MAEIRCGRRVLFREGHLTQSGTRVLFISGNPSTKNEARRWIDIGIHLTVTDSATNLPVPEKDGRLFVIGLGWTGFANLAQGIVLSLD